MTDTDKQIIDGMTGVDKAIWFAGREARDRGAKVSDRVELATRLGVTRQAIHFFAQQGWFPDDIAQRIHGFYGIPVAELVKPAA